MPSHAPLPLSPISLPQRHPSYRDTPVPTKWSPLGVMPSLTVTPGATLCPWSAGARTGYLWGLAGTCTSCRTAPWPSVVWG